MRKSQGRQLTGLEDQYWELLVVALRTCADGKCELFGQNDGARDYHPSLTRRFRLADDLIELGNEIEALRSKLGYAEPFPPHARLMSMRQANHDNTPGEPKLARQWLDEIEADN